VSTPLAANRTPSISVASENWIRLISAIFPRENENAKSQSWPEILAARAILPHQH
jgi:hypothetical protein